MDEDHLQKTEKRTDKETNLIGNVFRASKLLGNLWLLIFNVRAYLNLGSPVYDDLILT